MEQPCLSCRILSPLPLISSLLKELISFPVPRLLLLPPGAPWCLRAAGQALSPAALGRAGRAAYSEGGLFPKGTEREHPSSLLHANVMCLEMSRQGEPCAFSLGTLASEQEGSAPVCCTCFSHCCFSWGGRGGEGSSRDTIYTLIYIYIHALVLKGKHCMIVIEMMLR